MREGERLFAFLDDLYMVTVPDRIGAMFAVVQSRCGTEVGFAHGLARFSSRLLTQLAAVHLCGEGLICQLQNRASRCWAHLWDTRTSWRPISGTCWNPTGPSWNGLPLVQDVQCAWNLLLHSAVARGCYQLRVVRPELTMAFAQGHDDGVWSYLCRIMNVDPDPNAVHTRQVATFPPLSWWIGTSETPWCCPWISECFTHGSRRVVMRSCMVHALFPRMSSILVHGGQMATRCCF